MGAWLAEFRFDLRRGITLLRKSPGFTRAAALTLASARRDERHLQRSALDRPAAVAVPNPEQLVSVEEVNQLRRVHSFAHDRGS